MPIQVNLRIYDKHLGVTRSFMKIRLDDLNCYQHNKSRPGYLSNKNKRSWIDFRHLKLQFYHFVGHINPAQCKANSYVPYVWNIVKNEFAWKCKKCRIIIWFMSNMTMYWNNFQLDIIISRMLQKFFLWHNRYEYIQWQSEVVSVACTWWNTTWVYKSATTVWNIR